MISNSPLTISSGRRNSLWDARRLSRLPALIILCLDKLPKKLAITSFFDLLVNTRRDAIGQLSVVPVDAAQIWVAPSKALFHTFKLGFGHTNHKVYVIASVLDRACPVQNVYCLMHYIS